MHPENISIADYTYVLPEEKIAKYPLTERDQSKLLIYSSGKISEDIFKNISTHLPSNSLLVFNDTKVVEARILFQKPTGGVIEIFCLEPAAGYADITTAMLQKRKVLWQCLIGGASKWKHGQILEKKITSNETEFVVSARYMEKKADSFVIEFSWDNDFSFAEVLHHAGLIPLPPYIKRAVENNDKERYQTIYAHFEGSVAAPTAGFHFTDRVFKLLDQKNIKKEFVTLHVGAGTFKPVKSETIGEHEMHTEFIEVAASAIENILNNLSGTIIPVGTTSLRTIESVYWLGVKIMEEKNPAELFIPQWFAYERRNQVSVEESLSAVLNFMKASSLKKIVARTQIIIVPGYEFKIAKALITNFHQPQSTLLLLVAAFIGKQWLTVYQYALENNFRFLSYGDSCLFFRRG
ncbi:MAG: S-adenosylmethionine tRNA ribosyltransferase [Chitinophagaceae bacterium]